MKWFKKKRIIVPFDFSVESTRAVRVGISLAEEKKDVHVVHVLHELPAGEVDYYWNPSKNDKRKAEAEKAVKDSLSLADITDIQTDVLVGDPATEIVDFAKEIQTDLIVIPSHGYGGMKRMLLGSVARGVVRHAKCPVLVLKQ